MSETDRVCAVLVTYNRNALLRECLDGVLAQTHPVHVIVIDNASTDETPQTLLEYAGDPRVEVVRMETNGGGAGGFSEGLKRAAQRDVDWAWLMDDDTIPKPDCLEALVRGAARAADRPSFVASRVEWTDGRVHPMNRGSLDDRIDNVYKAAQAGGIAVRAASFVSVMISIPEARKHGLPMTDYFIWCDDLEYTTRLSREGWGMLVPESVAVHKTEYFELQTLTPRHYFHVRNTLWMQRFSPGLTADERRGVLLRHIRGVARTLVGKHPTQIKKVTIKGVFDGLVRKPDLAPLQSLSQPSGPSQPNGSSLPDAATTPV